MVIILGILAAIVIPQFSSASSDAKKASLQSTVQTLRSQIALYKLQHGDTLPNLSGTGAGNGWPALTASSVYQGTTVGPYMQSIPVNSLTNGSVVKDGTAAPRSRAPTSSTTTARARAPATCGAPPTRPAARSCPNVRPEYSPGRRTPVARA